MSLLRKWLGARSQVGHTSEKKKDVDYPNGLKPYKNTSRRRTGISAEVESQASETWTKTLVPKSAEQLERIKAATSESFLFAPLGTQQKQDIYDCMEEIKCEKGTFVIEQFDDGDFFYVIDSGKFQVYVSDAKERPQKQDDGKELSEEEKAKREEIYPGRKVVVLEKGSFGEIALMYNTPRTASVQAITDGVLFRLDRSAFRNIVVKHARTERQDREKRLKEVPILEGMTETEISQIADILTSRTYNKDEYVIKHGEEGDSMYIVTEGKAEATHFIDGKEVTLRPLNIGDYFGEVAIIKKETRSANVKAVSDVLRVDSIDRATVERLFGSIRTMMKERMDKEYSFAPSHPPEEEALNMSRNSSVESVGAVTTASPHKPDAIAEEAEDPEEVGGEGSTSPAVETPTPDE